MRTFVFIGAFVVAVAAVSASKLSHNNKPVEIPPAAPGAAQNAPRKIKENVVAFSTGDQAMIAAKQRAKATLPRFRQLMAAKTPGTYTIKFPLTQNGATEHIWLQVNGEGKGTEFFGRLANDPVNGDRYKMGDWMTVSANDVEDWMVRSDAGIYGGYTARVALPQMPKAQQEKFAKLFKD